jgi:hypothetical protein
MEIQTGNEARISSRKTLPSTTKTNMPMERVQEKYQKRHIENWIFYPKPTICIKY